MKKNLKIAKELLNTARQLLAGSKAVSLDNGNTFHTPEDLEDINFEADMNIYENDNTWGTLLYMMDSDILDEIGGMGGEDNAQGRQDFLVEYLSLATEDLILG